MQRLALAWRREGRAVALVPTMGCLHAGHLSLVNAARRRVGPQGKVVLSLYVNPTQFGPEEDLGRYPRDWKRDRRLCREAGVDCLFAPDDTQMYPGREAGLYSTYVEETVLSRRMEGASRPDHFRGVTTIVTKLFVLVLPEHAFFGAKDFQQAAVVRRVTADLNLPVRVWVRPTIREADGLALSSRNRYLTPGERRQATVLWRVQQEARRRVRRAGARGLPVAGLRRSLVRMVEAEPDARLDYLEFFDAENLEPVPRVRPGSHLALAVFVGRTRLIDNGGLA